jgi:hypothetical protein
VIHQHLVAVGELGHAAEAEYGFADGVGGRDADEDDVALGRDVGAGLYPDYAVSRRTVDLLRIEIEAGDLVAGGDEDARSIFCASRSKPVTS